MTETQKISEMIQVADLTETRVRSAMKPGNIFTGVSVIAREVTGKSSGSLYRVALDAGCRILQDYELRVSPYGLITEVRQINRNS